MGDLVALDVVIGLIFLFFMLSIICSALQEGVAAIMNLRATTLRHGVENLLSGSPEITEEGKELTQRVYHHSLVQALTRPGSKTGPSYIPSRTFVAALLNLKAATSTMAEVRRAIDDVKNPQLREALEALEQRAGGDVVKFQRGAEEWFDDSMERVSGWYRRKVTVILTVIATILVIALNADTIRLGQNLWNDQSVRKAVIANAGATVEQGGEEVGVERVADQVEELQALKVPLGWSGDGWEGPDWLFMKLLGLVLTVAALSLGAPFWFDLLSKVARIRVSGAPPPTTDSVRRGEGEETRAGATASAAPEEP